MSFIFIGCSKTEEADIYFLIDESGSIVEKEFQLMKKFILEFLLMFHIGQKHVRVGLVKFSSEPKLEFNLVDTTDRASLDTAVDKVYLDGGGTNIGTALTYMQSRFQESVTSRPGPEIPRILIVITDGKSQDEVETPAKLLREQGVNIYTIGVRGANQEELIEISGDAKKTFTVNNFDALFPIKDDIVQNMCSKEGECNLCHLENKCPAPHPNFLYALHYIALESLFFSCVILLLRCATVFLAACKDMKADVLMLVESSDIILPTEFLRIKLFIESLIKQSVIGPDALRMGLVQYASQPKLEFLLNDNEADMRAKTEAMRQLGGGIETGRALQFASDFFDVSQGGRPGLPKILIVISKGKSQDEVADAASKLKRNGVLIYAIGIGSANRQQMDTIGTSHFYRRNFTELQTVSEEVMFLICHLNQGL